MNRTASGTLTIAEVKTGKKVYPFVEETAQRAGVLPRRTPGEDEVDARLPGEGLLVYHVDDSVEGNDNEHHPQVKLIEADGRTTSRTAPTAATPATRSQAPPTTPTSRRRRRRTRWPQRPRNLRLADQHRQVGDINQSQGLGVVSAARRAAAEAGDAEGHKQAQDEEDEADEEGQADEEDPTTRKERRAKPARKRASRSARDADHAGRRELVARGRPRREVDAAEGRRRPRRARRARRAGRGREGRGRKGLAEPAREGRGDDAARAVPASAAGRWTPPTAPSIAVDVAAAGSRAWCSPTPRSSASAPDAGAAAPLCWFSGALRFIKRRRPGSGPRVGGWPPSERPYAPPDPRMARRRRPPAGRARRRGLRSSPGRPVACSTRRRRPAPGGSFPAAAEDYFHDMDGALPLSREGSRAEHSIVWTGGNDRFWDHPVAASAPSTC